MNVTLPRAEAHITFTLAFAQLGETEHDIFGFGMVSLSLSLSIHSYNISLRLFICLSHIF